MNLRTPIFRAVKNKKRWQDVLDIIDAGIDVITAINIQHIESINAEVKTNYRH